MNAIELVRDDLRRDPWVNADPRLIDGLREIPDQSPFLRHRLFIIHGRVGQFEFRALPSGSFAYYAADGKKAIRLTRKHLEIESLLADEWDALPIADPVRLASLVLRFYDGGIRSSHDVLRDASSLREVTELRKARSFGGGFKLNERAIAAVLPRIGSTSSSVLSDGILSVRAVTLLGWMHTKQNLGIESFTIDRHGKVGFADRIVLTSRTFSDVPGIRY
jgi:hypothetical protein